MPKALFDVNALIALIDPNHVFHERMHSWWEAHRQEGWASCPLTENGVLRVMSQPSYSPKQPFRISDLVQSLRLFQSTDHEFWGDDLSIFDPTIFDVRWVIGHRQITDAYLLALAVRNQGHLVTLDGQTPLAAVRGALQSHLVVPRSD